ncbi:MAG: PAS domain S-box protein [Phycisphaerales bacterium]|nr:PAS domain S-box protein [Phycisphaerales bacterium]
MTTTPQHAQQAERPVEPPDQSIQADPGAAVAELAMFKFALDEHAIVAITDPKGVITYVNGKFCAISGFARDELLGQTHRIINSKHHPKEFFVDMWKTIAKGRVWRGEVCNRAKGGSLYWVDTTIVPFKDAQNKITQYVAIRADITSRKNAEEELRRVNEELQQFVYTASHDLKSPLLTIQGFISLLQRDIASGQLDNIAEHANRIERAALRQRRNIDDLLAISRVGRSMDDLQYVNIAGVVQTLIDEMRPQFDQAGVMVQVIEPLPIIQCDAGRVQQALQNLLTNALKYGRREGVQPCVTISSDTVNGEVRLLVADNGPGIDEKYHDRAFGLFQRLSKEGEGTGVGLAIVKRVAEVHRGRVWIEQTPGGGATFCMSFPNAAAEALPQAA